MPLSSASSLAASDQHCAPQPRALSQGTLRTMSSPGLGADATIRNCAVHWQIRNKRKLEDAQLGSPAASQQTQRGGAFAPRARVGRVRVCSLSLADGGRMGRRPPRPRPGPRGILPRELTAAAPSPSLARAPRLGPIDLTGRKMLAAGQTRLGAPVPRHATALAGSRPRHPPAGLCDEGPSTSRTTPCDTLADRGRLVSLALSGQYNPPVLYPYYIEV